MNIQNVINYDIHMSIIIFEWISELVEKIYFNYNNSP